MKTRNKSNHKSTKRTNRKRKFDNLLDKIEKSVSLNNNDYINLNNLKNSERCRYCCQTQPEYVNFPSDAEPECIVLANENLANIYSDQIDIITHNLTNYSIYDESEHMCAIDSGVMESNVPLYLTGYVKPIYDPSSSIEKGVEAMELGPILEWWLSSYDGGSQALIGVATNYADYLLIEPHPQYKKYLTSVIEKIHLSKLVIENIIDNQECDDPTYEDLLNYIVNSINPATGRKFTEEDLIAHGQFVLNQLLDYDSNDTYHLPLANTQCIETLSQLSGAVKSVVSSKWLRRVRQQPRVLKSSIDKHEFSKATTTELVKDVFENKFSAQLDSDSDLESSDAIKTSKIIDLTQLDNVNNSVLQIDLNTTMINEGNNHEVLWKNHKLIKKMFVIFKNSTSPRPFIGRIEYSFKSNSNSKVHLTLFLWSDQTVLGKASDCQEIFALKKCTSIKVSNIIRIADVKQKIPNDNWFNLGDGKLQDLKEPVNRENKNQSFFYQLQYDDVFGRFEYPNIEDLSNNSNSYCHVCVGDKMEKKSQIPNYLELIDQDNNILYYYSFELHNEKYKVGNFIYLEPDIFSISSRLNFVEEKPFIHIESNTNKTNQVLQQVDETVYSEYYRKTLENTMCGSNKTTQKPFEIGEILAIYSCNGDTSNVKLLVRRMYRAEQIPLNDVCQNADMNMLYWSDENFRVQYSNICGKCYVSCITNINNPLKWSADGPDRFYFSKQYEFITGSIIPHHQLPNEAKLTGKEVQVNYNHKFVTEDKIQYIPSYKKIQPLKGLDIFAGCGGLSKGLEESGVVKTQWAVECDDKAATAFELNHPESTVFVEDCNKLLKLAMSGNKINSKNQRIPQRGEVDFICGSPPCQGFSGMNQFNSGEYSFFKNSLIVSFLSYIDYYRPKYFVMENVRNFVSFKKSMVLKLTLRCITRMGYQCTFGILQAGNFGVPQTRKRLIIMAAAPGEQLPLYPEPIHVFNERGSNLNVQVGEMKFRTNCKYEESAPMRTVTVYDAWSDLPEISNGADLDEIPYNSKPITHLQKLLRYPDYCFPNSLLTDHICKAMSPIVQARMELIPISEGSDWRDLPNIRVKLSDGTMTNKLVYSHYDVKNGNTEDGAFRGVCHCASEVKCCPQDRQNNTIIPWCLPHTGNRHNNWAGLYGRLAWTGFCSTTITNPEPMGKQGRVLHPEQHRVVSVRECARSQGFTDSFLFYGPIINKHRQIGNAVPPPMGKAIGYEIIKAILNSHGTVHMNYSIRPML